MSDIFETTEYIVKGNPDTAETPPSPGGGFNPDSLSASTNTPVDADLIITKESNTWVKKTFAKVWDYIKSKIGIDNSQGSANKFLNEQGTFTVVNSGKEYDLEFNNDLDEVTLTEDSQDKTTLPLVATYVGTRANWNNLSAADKAKYRIVHFTDESEGISDAYDIPHGQSNVGDDLDDLQGAITDINASLTNKTTIKYKDLSIGTGSLAANATKHENIDSDSVLSVKELLFAKVIGCPTDESSTAQFSVYLSQKTNGTGRNVNIVNHYSGTLNVTLYIRIYYID